MKKTNLIKIVLILIVSAILILFSTNVFAADSSDDFNDLTSTLENTSSNNTTNNTNASNTNNTSANNTNTNNVGNNTSIYNNNNLPKTGIEDSMPLAMLIVVFGISAAFAYKKIKDYRNL